MIRNFITSIALLSLLSACTSDSQKTPDETNTVPTDEIIEQKKDSIIFGIAGAKSDIDGVDSLTILSANGIELFKIAEGGNLEILTDTVVEMEGSDLGIITMADYFQDNQIFYVIYNPVDKVLLQSSRLYLPYAGLDITQYKQLDSIALDGDSMQIKSHTKPEVNLSLALDTLILNRDGIINFYEFE